MYLKGEIWKVTDSTIVYSFSRIIDTGINSGRNGWEANEVVNKVHRLHTNIHMFGITADNVANIYSDYRQFIYL